MRVLPQFDGHSSHVGGHMYPENPKEEFSERVEHFNEEVPP